LTTEIKNQALVDLLTEVNCDGFVVGTFVGGALPEHQVFNTELHVLSYLPPQFSVQMREENNLSVFTFGYVIRLPAQTTLSVVLPKRTVVQAQATSLLSGRFVYIVGPPGTGKTHLVQMLAKTHPAIDYYDPDTSDEVRAARDELVSAILDPVEGDQEHFYLTEYTSAGRHPIYRVSKDDKYPSQMRYPYEGGVWLNPVRRPYATYTKNVGPVKVYGEYYGRRPQDPPTAPLIMYGRLRRAMFKFEMTVRGVLKRALSERNHEELKTTFVPVLTGSSCWPLPKQILISYREPPYFGTSKKGASARPTRMHLADAVLRFYSSSIYSRVTNPPEMVRSDIIRDASSVQSIPSLPERIPITMYSGNFMDALHESAARIDTPGIHRWANKDTRVDFVWSLPGGTGLQEDPGEVAREALRVAGEKLRLRRNI
jgi:energy-coupling factor transporter ATP-binding protein EcfA2